MTNQIPMRKISRALLGLIVGVLFLNVTAIASPSEKLILTASASSELSVFENYSPTETVASTQTPIYNFSSFPAGSLTSSAFNAIIAENLSSTTVILSNYPVGTVANSYTSTAGGGSVNLQQGLALNDIDGSISLNATEGGSYTITTSGAPAFTLLVQEVTIISVNTVSVTCNGDANGTLSASVNFYGPASNMLATLVHAGGTLTSTVAANGAVSFSGLRAGAYTLTVQHVGLTGATASSTRTGVIGGPASPLSLVATPANVQCNGLNNGSVTLTWGGGYANSTYTLSSTTISGTTLIGGALTATSTTLSGLAPGTYTYTLSNNTGGCQTSVTITITEPPVLTLSATVASNFNGYGVSCFGNNNGTISATAAGGISSSYTYTLASPALSNQSEVRTGANVLFTNLRAGTYSLTLTDANECSTATISLVITEPTALTLTHTLNGGTPGNSGVYCATGGSLVATAGGGLTGTGYFYSYTLTGSAYTSTTLTSTASSTFTSLTGGSYTLSVIDGNGCTTTVQTFTIVVPSAVTLTSTVSNFNGYGVSCFGATNGTITAAATASTTLSYIYTLARPLATSITNTTGSFTGLPAGTYTITVVDTWGCSSAGPITATLTAPAALTLTRTTSNYSSYQVSCFGASDGTITATAGGGTVGAGLFYTYTLLNASGTATTLTSTGSIAFTGLAAGTYTLSVTDANSCTTTQQRVVLASPDPISVAITTSNYAGYQVSCTGALDGSITATPSGGVTGTWIYVLTRPLGLSTLTVTTTSASATFSGLIAGTYTLSVTDANGCTTTQSVVTLVANSVTVTSTSLSNFNGFNIGCNGGSNGTLTVTASRGPLATATSFVYTLSRTSGGPITSATGVFTNLSAGSYTLTAADQFGCTTAGTLIRLTEPSAPISLTNTVSSFNGGFNISCFNGSNGTITATAAGGLTGTGFNYTYALVGTSYSRTTIVASTASPTSRAFNGLRAGTYTLSVSDDNGCTVTSTTIVLTQPTAITISATIPVLVAPNWTIACNGNQPGTISLSVSGGVGSYTYSWIGAGGFSATTASITTFVAGDYTVTVRDGNGCVTSTTYTLTDPTVVVTNQPANQTVCAGTTATFTASAVGQQPTGTSALAYQWQSSNDGVNWTSITGATNATYALTGTTVAQSGNRYRVRVTGFCNEVFSNPATLTVNTNTAITVQPVAPTVCNTSAVTFGVTAVGTNLTYQWFNTAGAISGATSSSYTVASASSNDSYYVVVTGTCGTVTSSTVTLTVNQPVAITAQPISAVVCSGSVATLTVGATGTSLSYQWYNASGAITGATAATYTTTAAGSYFVVVSNVCGREISSEAVVTVNTNTAITTQPASVRVCVGSSASFSVTAIGTNLTYQWFNGSTAITGATSSAYTINNTATSNSGNYSVVVTGTCGTVTSSTVTLTVDQPVAITAQPVSAVVCSGSVATLTVAASGTSLSYQWYNASGAITGATAATYTTTAAGSYFVIVSNSCGQVISSVAAVTLNTNTSIITQPAAVTVCPGSSASFSVTAIGTNLTYQWFNGTTAITGATSSVFTVNNVQTSNAGNYSVVVSGTCGTVTSSAVALTVPVPTVAVTSNSADNILCQGQTVVLTATGGATYLWYRNGTQITGAVGATLSATTPGEYSVRSINATGCQSVSVATIVITQLDRPRADFTYDAFCRQFPIRFTNTSVTTNAGAVTYVWTDNAGNTSTLINPVFTYNVAGPINMTLSVTPTRCPMNRDSITKSIALVSAAPGVRMPTVDALKGVPVRLEARNFGTAYLWSPATPLDDATLPRPTATLNAEQQFTIRISTAAGCQTVDTLLVRVFNNYGIYVPNVFSPNGDGINDRLFVNLVGIRSINYFRIFDRYGKVVFESATPTPGWDGRLNGKDLPLDSYVWVVEAVTTTGITITERGAVTLIR
jgi:gliding motility-associated-like protein